MAEQPPSPQRWKKLGSREVARTRIFSVESVDFHHPKREKPQDFFVINAPDWVNVLALTPGGHLVLVRQFRYGIDDFSVEIPGGVIDLGEDPVSAGVRELREETGYVGASARPNEVTYSEDWMRPDYVPPAPTPLAATSNAPLPSSAGAGRPLLPAEVQSTDPELGIAGMMAPPGGGS